MHTPPGAASDTQPTTEASPPPEHPAPAQEPMAVDPPAAAASASTSASASTAPARAPAPAPLPVSAPVPATATGAEQTPASQTERRRSSRSHPPRQSLPAVRPPPSPSPDRQSGRSRLKRARQSLAAGVLPSAIAIDADVEEDEEVKPEPEPNAPALESPALEPEPEPEPEPDPQREAEGAEAEVQAEDEAAVAGAALLPAHSHSSRSQLDLDHEAVSETIAAEPEAGPSSTPGRAPAPARTPGTGRRSSRVHRERTPAEVLAEPPIKISAAEVGDAAYGKYYEALVRTLRTNVVDRGLSRLSLEQMQECYPLLAADRPEMFENVWSSMLHELRDKTLSGAMKLINDYQIPRRMRTFADMVDDARAWAEAHPGEGRPDAWRPDLTPFVISAGANFELYDDNWALLRDEYRGLVNECQECAERVQEKLAMLQNLDNGVSDSVVELAETNALLKNFPTADMMSWNETVENKLGSRKE